MVHPASLAVALAASVAWGSTVIGGDIKDLVFDAAGSPYVVEQDITVPAGKKVVMQAGAVIMFKPYTGLSVEGEVVVQGTADKPVVFTSVNDSKYGPETGQLANAFDWNGVHIQPQCVGFDASNLCVKYSVYGIKSQSLNVRLRDAVFAQNGQFHFTINDKIQLVQDNIPYSYNVQSAAPVAKQPEMPLAMKNSDWQPKKNTGSTRAKLVVRYTCLGAGLVAAGVGTYFAVAAAGDANRRDASGGGSGWSSANESLKQNDLGMYISYGASAAFLAAFGITFFF